MQMGLLTPPKMTRVDIVFSYRNFLWSTFQAGTSTIYRHKVKSITCLLGIVAAHKTLGLYKSIKSALNPLGELAAGMDGEDAEVISDSNNQGDGAEGDAGMDPLRQAFKKKSESREDKQAEQLLRNYLKQDAMHLFQVKIFQSSQRNVLENLPK